MSDNASLENDDALFTITCGRCGQPATLTRWKRRAIGGDLPANEFQCPACGLAFRRTANPDHATKSWAPAIVLVPIQPRL